jgi:hypothetical protein
MPNIIPEEPRIADTSSFLWKVRSFLKKKSLADQLASEMKADRDALFSHLDDEGEEDDKGNLIITFEEPIEGHTALQKQRRVSRKLVDVDTVTEKLEQLGLRERVVKEVVTLQVDEEELLQAHWEGLISEEDLDALYPATTTWALIPVKPRAKRK